MVHLPVSHIRQMPLMLLVTSSVCQITDVDVAEAEEAGDTTMMTNQTADDCSYVSVLLHPRPYSFKR
ncbi:MAG TPA: hypothetical protein VE130_04770 [Nitrososphaeraceae archaeon]|nr:hypothetical protein [Nitrososphaeraceae archaeon]